MEQNVEDAKKSGRFQKTAAKHYFYRNVVTAISDG